MSANSKQIVSTSKLDSLADSISAKTGIAVPLTIDQMKATIDDWDYSWMGDQVTLIAPAFYTLDTTFDKTGYASWTPGTSATSIIATQTVSNAAFTANMVDYEYMIEWLWQCQAAYPAGQTYKLCMDQTYGTMYQTVHRRPYGLGNFQDEIYNYNYCTTLFTSSAYNIYWKSDGTHTWTGTLYGVYASGATAATLSHTTNNSITVTPKTPVFSARCNSSYFSTARAAQVDQKNSTIRMVGNLYRMKAGTCTLRNMYGKAVHLYSHPLEFQT